MAWHIMEKLVEQVAQHSTLVGKFWSTFFFVLRFLMVVSIADSVFGDEQGNFVCNTLTPGCSNVCFNDFSPISLIRLWALQVIDKNCDYDYSFYFSFLLTSSPLCTSKVLSVVKANRFIFFANFIQKGRFKPKYCCFEPNFIFRNQSSKTNDDLRQNLRSVQWALGVETCSFIEETFNA